MRWLGDLWHVGVVVHDLNEAMHELSGAFGVSWTSVNDQNVEIEVDGEPAHYAVRWAATATERPDLEIIEASEGLWSRESNGGAALHHLAYWSEDLDRDVEDLTRSGYRLEASGADGDGRLRFVYMVGPSGIRIELGAEHTREAWERWVGGGTYGLEIA